MKRTWTVTSAVLMITAAMATVAIAQAPAQELPAIPSAIPAEPAVTLPSTTVTPDTSAPMSETPPVNTNPDAGLPIAEIVGGLGAGASNEPIREYSFGEAEHSLLFTPTQINSMKQALRTYESIRKTEGAGNVEITQLTPEVLPPVTEPVSYPSYYLSSIVYHSKNDWVVWLNNTRITPKTNNGEVRVTAVNANQASFVWAPTYGDVLARRETLQAYAPMDKVSHRQTKPTTAKLDSENGTVVFTLRPNQSFSAGYMSTFEGKIAAPALPLLPSSGPEATSGPAPGMVPASQLTPAQAQTIQSLLDSERGPAAPGEVSLPMVPQREMNTLTPSPSSQP